MANVDSKHPLYQEFAPDWEQMRDTYRGQRVVKDRGDKYLPPTSGMIEDGAATGKATAGEKAFAAYLMRAVFPELVGDAVEAMLGVMHYKPPTINLPAPLEALIDRATLRNESLAVLLRRINEEQLVTGRVGLLADVPDGQPVGEAMPYIAMYKAEAPINWDEGERDQTVVDSLNLVVIDETEEVRQADGFEWERKEKYRVLILGDLVANEREGSGAIYRVGVFTENNTFSEAAMLAPSIGGKTAQEIPFVFINTKDVVATPDDPPLLGLSNLTLTIYRGEADYRQALFMQGQDTLVTIGLQVEEGKSVRTGAGARIDLPNSPDADAKYIGVSSEGLTEMRTALENDYTRGESRATALVEAVGGAAESGEALRVRVAARTASLNQIALTGAFGLQELLKKVARWMGLAPAVVDEIEVVPNLDFVSDSLDGLTLVNYMTAKSLGAPWSLESLHELMQARGLTELTFEEEIEKMEAEAEEGLPGAKTGGDDDAGATEDGAPVEDGEEGDPEANGEEDGEEEEDGEDDE